MRGVNHCTWGLQRHMRGVDFPTRGPMEVYEGCEPSYPRGLAEVYEVCEPPYPRGPTEVYEVCEPPYPRGPTEVYEGCELPYPSVPRKYMRCVNRSTRSDVRTVFVVQLPGHVPRRLLVRQDLGRCCLVPALVPALVPGVSLDTRVVPAVVNCE